jgi:tRNA G26 N,N-dimethylase Trm1
VQSRWAAQRGRSCSFPGQLLTNAVCDLAAGYRVSGTHANPLGMKTDAPWDVIWDIMRAWVADHPVKKQVQRRTSVSEKLALHRH